MTIIDNVNKIRLGDEPFWVSIYIAGPMTGYDNFNYDAFNDVAMVLRESDYQQVNNPAEHFNGDQRLPWTKYISQAANVVLGARVIVLLPGWEASTGARLEAALGVSIGARLYRAIETDGVYRFEYVALDNPREFVAYLIGLDQRIEPVETYAEEPHEEASRLVNGARQDNYGHPLDNFTGTAGIWNGILHKKLNAPLTAEDISLCMVGVKLSRETHVPKRDNIVDAHGYLMTYAMVQDERKRRGEE